MFNYCLEALMSGIISVSGQELLINTNSGIHYNIKDKPYYVIADKYNQEQLCQNKTRFQVKYSNNLELISAIE